MGGEPNQVERILVDGDFIGQSGGIVAAKPTATVGADADTKVADTSGETSVASDVLDGGVNIVVYLRRVGDGSVAVIVQGQEEDIGDQR